MQLNNEQQLAVEHKEGPLLILAGAGSGKTRVLTERIVNLIKTGSALPHQIFAVTFTNKAAGEMKQRVERTIGPAGKGLFISTFHSACLRILRENPALAGLKNGFAIADDSEQLTIIKKVMTDLNIGEKLISHRSAQDKISRSKDLLIGPENHPDGDFFNAKVKLIYETYEKELKKNNLVDFGDLIFLTVLMFKNHPEALFHYQKRFKFIMVDEYQDTNHSQYQLVKMLADGHKNICVVGDPDQSIYAWRGADISNILEFERDFEGATVIKLEQNYRSTKVILAASDAVIANNKSRKPKTLWTSNQQGENIKLIVSQNEREEAKLIVKEIQKNREAGIPLKQMALFYRTNAQSRVFEDEFRRESIQYAIYGGIRFYDRAEIKNVIAYLRLINNEDDNVSLKRIINVPTRGIGKTTLDKLVESAENANCSILKFIRNELHNVDISGPAKKRLVLFSQMMQAMSDQKALPLPELAGEVVKTTGYVRSLSSENTDEANERIANIDELISAISESVKQTPEMTLADFLDQVALVSAIDKFDADSDYVPLMTLHLAKGLEFPIVFITGLEEGILPHIRSIDSEEDIEEERRLFYVGMTRAEKQLFISYATERMVRGNYNYNVPSRFLDEIPNEYIETLHHAFVPKPKTVIKRDFFNQSSGDDFGQVDPFGDDFSQVASKAKPAQAEEAGFRTGQRVHHPMFGNGIVRKAEGAAGKQKLIVQFGAGTLKKLSAEYAKLTPL